MKAKYLNFEDYNKYFCDLSTSCGSEVVLIPPFEEYFVIQTDLPPTFFDESCYDRNIKVKFELLCKCKTGDKVGYIFKPWVVNIQDPKLYSQFEQFIMILHEKLFFNMLVFYIWAEYYTINKFKRLRVISEIPNELFSCFGLNQKTIPIGYKTKNLIIKRKEQIDQNIIENFYKKNSVPINEQCKQKYFNERISKWFEIKLRENNKLIGLLRIYQHGYISGFFIEYLLAKEFRKMGLMSEALKSFIRYIKNNSYALRIGADVSDENYDSIKLLEKFGFEKLDIDSPLLQMNYSLDLIKNEIVELEEAIDERKIAIKIDEQDFKKFKNYLL